MPDNRPPISTFIPKPGAKDPYHPDYERFYNTPLMPEAPVRAMQEKIDPGPSLERGPWEARLRGFGAGALEGLRQQTTPLNLAQLALIGIGGGVAPGAGRALGASAKAINASKVAKPIAGALEGLVEAVPVAKAAEPYIPLGEQIAEFAPKYGLEALNARRVAPAIPKIADRLSVEEMMDVVNRFKIPKVTPELLQRVPKIRDVSPIPGVGGPAPLPPQLSSQADALMEALTKIGVK